MITPLIMCTILVSKIFHTLGLPVFITLNQQKPDFTSIISHVCNFLCVISANSTALSLVSFAFDLLEGFGFSSSPRRIVFVSVSGFHLYSFVVANAIVVCNVALVPSAMEEESGGGYLAILRVCVLLKGRAFSTSLTLTVAVNPASAALEALFHYRVARAYDHIGGDLIRSFSMALEGILIAYLYSIVVLLDAVTSFVFFKTAKPGV